MRYALALILCLLIAGPAAAGWVKYPPDSTDTSETYASCLFSRVPWEVGESNHPWVFFLVHKPTVTTGPDMATVYHTGHDQGGGCAPPDTLIHSPQLDPPTMVSQIAFWGAWSYITKEGILWCNEGGEWTNKGYAPWIISGVK